MKKLFTLLFIFTVAATAATCFYPKKAFALETEGKAAYLCDYESGTTVYACNERKRLPIASMTKIMILDLVFEAVDEGRLSLDENVTVSKTASGMGGSQVFLQADKEYKAEDLIKSVIIASANDASVALAERLYGSESAAVDVMNERCDAWGLKDTLFSNVTGLPKPTQYSCAKDVAVMLTKLISHEKYFDFSKIWLDELTHPDGQKTTLTNTNKLSRYYAGCDGGKTGYTSDAGFCLAATAKKGTMRVVGVCIGEKDSKQRFKDVSEMFDYAFDNYSQKIVVDSDLQPKESVDVVCGKCEKVFVEPKESVYAFLKKNDKAEFTVEYSLSEKVTAPVKKGDVLGELTVKKDGVEYKKVDLVAENDVLKATFSDSFIKVTSNW